MICTEAFVTRVHSCESMGGADKGCMHAGTPSNPKAMAEWRVHWNKWAKLCVISTSCTFSCARHVAF